VAGEVQAVLAARWDAAAPKWAADPNHINPQQYIAGPTFRSLSGEIRGLRVLDAGCGGGWLTRLNGGAGMPAAIDPTRLRRILLLGSGGSGKSTLARRLGILLHLEVVHLDALFWHPGWVATPREEWVRVEQGVLARDRWIVDGNYGGTLDLRLAAADAVILLDLSRWTCIQRAVLRTLRSWWRPRADMAPGCPERLDVEYLKFLWWIWTYPTRRRPRLLQRLAELSHDQQMFRLRSDREVEAFVRQVEVGVRPREG